MTIYIQRNGNGQLETVDEFESRKEALAMLKDYRMSDAAAEYYTSRRACKDWREASKAVVVQTNK